MCIRDRLNCIVITTGTGNVTASRKQVQLARDYRATATNSALALLTLS